jgi:cytoskeletal protein CcmA (bactofilin family)
MVGERKAKDVMCYHCQAVFAIGGKALSATCPNCYKRVTLHDLVFRGEHLGQRVQTCGIVFVDYSGRVNAPVVEATEAVEVLGQLDARAVTSLGHVVIGASARWKGDCKAKVLVVQDGATIDGGFFQIGEPQPAPPPAQPPEL